MCVYMCIKTYVCISKLTKITEISAYSFKKSEELPAPVIFDFSKCFVLSATALESRI